MQLGLFMLEGNQSGRTLDENGVLFRGSESIAALFSLHPTTIGLDITRSQEKEQGLS